MNLSTNYVSVTQVSADNLEKRLRKVKKDLGPVTVQHLGSTATTRQITNAIAQQHLDGLRGLFDGQRKHVKGKDEQGRPFILTFHGERDETYTYELVLDDAFDLKASRELKKKNLLVHGDQESLPPLSDEPADGPLYELCKELGVPELVKEGQHPLHSFDRDRLFQFLQAAEERYPNQGSVTAAVGLYNRLAGFEPMYIVHAASEFVMLQRSEEAFDEAGTMTNVYALGLVNDFIEQLDIDPHLKSIATVTPVTAVVQVMKVLVESPTDLTAHQKNWAPFVAVHGQSSDFEAIVDYLTPAIDILSELRGQGPVVRKATADNAKRILAEFDAEFGTAPVEKPMVKQHPIFTFNYDAALAELRQIHAATAQGKSVPWEAFFRRQGLNEHAIEVVYEDFFKELSIPGRDTAEVVVFLLRRALIITYINELEQDPVLTGRFAMDQTAITAVRGALMKLFSGSSTGLEVTHSEPDKVLDYLLPVHGLINDHKKAVVVYQPEPETLTPVTEETTMNPVTLTKAPRCDVIIPEVTEMVLANLEPFGLSEHKDMVETYYRAALQAPTQEQAKMEIDALCSEFMDIGYENIDPFRFESYAMLQAVGKVFGEKPVNHPDTTHEPAVVTDRAIQGRTDVLDFFDMRKALFMERHWSLSRNKSKTNPEKFQIPGAIREQFPTLDLSKDEQRVALLHHYAAEVYAGEGAFEAACNYAGTDDAGHKYHISNGIQDVQLVVIWGNRITDLTLSRKQA